jgi:pimeloyl-ACP methyl ester carboxylesterase
MTTTDRTEIFYKDWGSGEPIVFSHGWPLSADDWDTQMFSSFSMATASLPMTGEGTDAPRRPATVTTWTTTPMTLLR